MTNPTSTPEQFDVFAAFRAALMRLRVDAGGLTRDNPLRHLDAVADLSIRVRELAAAADTPEQMLMYRLACLAQELRTTLFAAPDRERIVRDFMLARAEVLALDLSTNPDKALE